MNNTSADKFAECSYKCYDIRPIDDVLRFGCGQYHKPVNNGQGIADNKDGSGWAKGYSEDSNSSPAHYLFGANIKQ